MSDSKHSTVTYTSVSEDDLYMGSPRIEVLVFEVPPSPDYVPGPEEPEQVPPSPIYIPFVPELVYPEFLPVDDEVFPAEEQPLPAADSPTHQSPGYIPESDPEEDLEEDDEEDPEEDPADYPADRGDDDDEHLERVSGIPSCWDQTERCTTISSHVPEMWLPLRKRLCRTTPGPGYEVGESSAASTARHVGPATARADLYGFADMLDTAPGRPMTRELGYGIRDTWDDLVGAIQEIAPT
ncbi:hypothetical protein Tco_0206479, partial [Tanacetum coccineum]